MNQNAIVNSKLPKCNTSQPTKQACNNIWIKEGKCDVEICKVRKLMASYMCYNWKNLLIFLHSLFQQTRTLQRIPKSKSWSQKFEGIFTCCEQIIDANLDDLSNFKHVLFGTIFSLFDSSPRYIGIGANVDALEAYKNINSNKEHQHGIQTTF
jgi:hypothetical protein